MKRSLISGACSIFRLSVASRMRSSRGIPAGARRPIQPRMSKPGRSPASAIVGSSGRAIARFALDTPKALRRPAFTWPRTVAGVSKV